MPENLTFTNSIIRGLACAALHPQLRAVLLINATPTQVQLYARLMEQMLAVVTDAVPSSCTLHPATTEDQLWGLPGLPTSQGNPQFIQRGLLRTDDERPHQLVVIPDLATLSLPANRAAVMAMGADILHVERHGQQDQWQPNLCWLAGCDEHEIGRVSPHLLDRFLVRIPVPISQAAECTSDDLLRELYGNGSIEQDDLQLHVSVVAALQQARNHEPPSLTKLATEQILQYISAMDAYSPRRDLALARLAVVLAWLDDVSQVNADHIDDAAQIMGLTLQRKKPSQPADQRQENIDKLPLDRPSHEISDEPKQQVISTDDKDIQIGPAISTPVYESDTQAKQPTLPLSTGRSAPYPEDETMPDRAQDSLRLPIYRTNTDTQRRRGATIGVEPTRGVDDLALASTFFEALKFQALRRRQTGRIDTGLIIEARDLRRYRRLSLPEALLVMVIDYTALEHCDWTVELRPYLEWAYTSRATIALIRVGAKDAESELQAEKFLGRSLLDPQIGRALMAAPGMATPLAHGLDLAHQILRHDLQHGRSAIVQARLVVISDGRGNVPLAVSYANEMPKYPINREGIDDALQIAHAISSLDRLEINMIDTQPPQHRELLQLLADTLEPVSALLDEPEVE